ncbi:vanadium-dependent haloperoxidase [Galbibacter sp. EGI 63066]|uniref:vanadium-dependent haloperoxidase n=1 Tax=Galbibacter sp. EGI 63066 TaxID=2993559 RepID=UPI0022495EC8|nr:vanadium-dependent haloperoxidase [Galbibacter sp. EGI 63066]MCX2680331.1 vanadium-dependent haloperoxidase [Galbibacter sp. EGI 63066]
MSTNNTYTPSKAHQWNRLTCDALHYTAAPPTIAARALAMVHTAMYDAWTNYNDGGCEVSTTTGSYLKQPDSECISENRKKTYSYAAYTVLQTLFCLLLPPEHKNMFRDFMCDCGYDPDDKNLKPDNPVGIGNLSAKLILECRAGDGSNPYATLHQGSYTDYSGYCPVNPPEPQPIKYTDRWQPLLKGHKPQTFLTAHWGLIKPFALAWGGQFRPSSPSSCGDRDFVKQAEVILNYSKNLTDEQKIIAELWAGMHEDKFEDAINDKDGSWGVPPAQCCRQARYLSKKYGHKNAYDIKMFFVVANALLDAGIAAWDCKVYYDYVRPVSAIRNIYRGKTIEAWGGPCEGTKKIEGENWIPYIPTPPFAEYVSGHSTFSAATAEVLTNFCQNGKYGESVTIPKGGSKIEPGCTPSEDVVLEWKTLKDTAGEAGISRLYGGIHFVDGDMEGRKLGSRVGCVVWDKAMQYFNGELG